MEILHCVLEFVSQYFLVLVFLLRIQVQFFWLFQSVFEFWKIFLCLKLLFVSDFVFEMQFFISFLKILPIILQPDNWLFFWLFMIFHGCKFSSNLPVLVLFSDGSFFEYFYFFLKHFDLVLSLIQKFFILIPFKFRGSFDLFHRHSSIKLNIFNFFSQNFILIYSWANSLQQIMVGHHIFYQFVTLLFHTLGIFIFHLIIGVLGFW